jgi:ribosomal-protein-alanine N-acetyltransferase
MSVPAFFTAIPTIETPRLVLRQIRPADAEDMFATFSDAEVMAFYGDPPHWSVADTRDLIERQQGWYARREGIRWGITRRGEDLVVGSCGLFRFDDEFRRAETGYELRRALWRQGIMREALTAMLTYALATTDLHRIEAVVDGGNEASAALLGSLGFRHEGTLRERFWFSGRYFDELYFGLLRAEWQALR